MTEYQLSIGPINHSLNPFNLTTDQTADDSKKRDTHEKSKGIWGEKYFPSHVTLYSLNVGFNNFQHFNQF